MPPLPKLPTLKPHSRVSVSLPRPAPTRVGAGVGAATAGKIKNPTSKITDSPLSDLSGLGVSSLQFPLAALA